MTEVESQVQALKGAPTKEKTIEQFHRAVLLENDETLSAAESNVASAAAPFDSKMTEISKGAGGEEVADSTLTVVDAPENFAASVPVTLRVIK